MWVLELVGQELDGGGVGCGEDVCLEPLPLSPATVWVSLPLPGRTIRVPASRSLRRRAVRSFSERVCRTVSIRLRLDDGDDIPAPEIGVRLAPHRSFPEMEVPNGGDPGH